MRKRNIQIIIRLDKNEHQRLCKLVKKSGLSQEAYIRHLINGVVPNDAPPPDYFSMMKELHGIGNNLNQIAQKAHVLNVIDVQRYDENMRLFNETVRKITNAVILPRRNE
jgi:Bacterial mobilisation protein (MobC)./Ribbon-helix-helix protein, copG family.